MQKSDCNKNDICALSLKQIENLDKIDNPQIIKNLIASISKYSSDAFTIINEISDNDKILKILDQMKGDQIAGLKEICNEKDLIIVREILNRIHYRIIYEFRLYPD